MIESTGNAFDAVAHSYDETFTDTPLGSQKRRQVHAVLRPLLRAGTQVLEVNCGTGRDAIFMASHGARVLATDASQGMVDVAKANVHRQGLDEAVSFERLSLQEVADAEIAARLGRFDLFLSDFDGLNCLEDPALVGRALDALLHVNGSAILVFMPPCTVVEIVGNLLRGRYRRAFGRLSRRAHRVHIGNGNYVHVWFHSVGSFVSALPASLSVRSVRAIGLLLPPTSMRTFYHRHRRLLDRLEARTTPLRGIFPINRMGDHVLIHIQRKRNPS